MGMTREQANFFIEIITLIKITEVIECHCCFYKSQPKTPYQTPFLLININILIINHQTQLTYSSSTQLTNSQLLNSTPYINSPPTAKMCEKYVYYYQVCQFEYLNRWAECQAAKKSGTRCAFPSCTHSESVGMRCGKIGECVKCTEEKENEGRPKGRPAVLPKKNKGSN